MYTPNFNKVTDHSILIEAMRTNVRGTETVLDACNRLRRKGLIASTSEVYGKNPQRPLCETGDSVFGSSAIRRWSRRSSRRRPPGSPPASWRATGPARGI